MIEIKQVESVPVATPNRLLDVLFERRRPGSVCWKCCFHFPSSPSKYELGGGGDFCHRNAAGDLKDQTHGDLRYHPPEGVDW
jgi:hypothetical protein